jgi:hypothetical protein
LGRVQLVEVDVEKGVFDRYGESKDENEDQDTNALSNIRILIFLIPHKDEDCRANKGSSKTNIGYQSPLALHDDEVANGVGNNL